MNMRKRIVCMVNDKVMGQPQLPVEVGVDPVSGRDVDKSEAVILQGGRGEALYFESEETARQYQGRASAAS